MSYTCPTQLRIFTNNAEIVDYCIGHVNKLLHVCFFFFDIYTSAKFCGTSEASVVIAVVSISSEKKKHTSNKLIYMANSVSCFIV